jgi:hypothetical protein
MTQANSRPGLSMAEVLTLPAKPRKIVQWMMKRSDGVSLAEVASQIGEDQQAAMVLLDELVEEGFVQEFLAAGEVNYRINLAAKKGIKQQQLQQSLAPGSPLAVIYNPSSDFAVKTGERFEICVTVTNKGSESALIDVFIDELSYQLIQWCEAPRQRLALGPNSISEVLFEFNVPVEAIPQTYNYLIIIDAPAHYPEDTPIRHAARIQVVPAIETVVQVSDPTFLLSPATSSQSPVQISPGGVAQFNINVHNRSDRVDRFRLICTDLDSAWFSTRYPEGLETLGLVMQNIGLELNPGEKGEITLLVNPPVGVTAGLYYPTIRLYSANNPDLILLDILYLEILPFHLVTAELLTIVGRIRRLSGVYEVKLMNSGNTLREIACQVILADEGKSYNQTISPTLLRLLPGEKANSKITITPKQWWQQPLFGGGRLINFRVELEDQQQFPLPNSSLAGTLIWEPRPWWQFLLLLLTGLGIVAVIGFIIWWSLRPAPSPRILKLSADDAVYQQANGDFIRLNWRVRNLRKLENLTLTGLLDGKSATVPPRVYRFNGKLPDELKPFCQMGEVLTCANVPTDARQAGNYVFELKAFAQGRPDREIDKLQTTTITIAPVPPPTILEFVSVQPIYQEVPENSRSTSQSISTDTIRVNWKISDVDKIKELRVIGRSPDGVVTSELQRYNFSQGIPKELADFCPPKETQLVCRNVPTKNKGAGDYIFELELFSKTDADKPTVAKKTDLVKVLAQASKIVEFKINGQEPAPKYSIQINPAKPVTSINLSWKVEGGNNIKVELQPAPGNVTKVGNLVYPISTQPSSETITLLVTSPTGEKVIRAVTIETILPPPKEATTDKPGLPTLTGAQPPADGMTAGGAAAGGAAAGGAAAGGAAAGGAAAGGAAAGGATAGGATAGGATAGGAAAGGASPKPASSPAPNAPAPTQPGKLSPLELPPGFD